MGRTWITRMLYKIRQNACLLANPMVMEEEEEKEEEEEEAEEDQRKVK